MGVFILSLPEGNEIRVARLGPLTLREAEAVLWVAEGKTSWEAGTILGVAECTMNAHVASAAAKLRASNRAHLITRAFVYGVLMPRLVMLMLVVQIAFNGVDVARRLRHRPCRRREEMAALVGPA